MDEKTVRAIDSILSKGDRAEVVPVKDGIKVIHIKRKVIAEEKRKG